jgi:hypothetical protein
MEAAGFSEVGNYLPNFMVLNPSSMLPSVDHGQKTFQSVSIDHNHSLVISNLKQCML